MCHTVEVSVIKIFELVHDHKCNAPKIQIVFVDVQFEKLHMSDADMEIACQNAECTESKQVSAVLH